MMNCGEAFIVFAYYKYYYYDNNDSFLSHEMKHWKYTLYHVHACMAVHVETIELSMRMRS